MFKKINKKVKNKLKCKKGMSTILFVISLLVFIMLFSFVFDLFLITYRQYEVSQKTTMIVRQLAKQSGVSYKTPLNFPGGSKAYMSSQKMIDSFDKTFTGLEVPKEDWKVQIIIPSKNGENYYDLTPYSDIETDYRQGIGIKLTYNYTWGLWSQFTPGIVKGQTVVEKFAFSEFKHDYSSWQGEN